MYNFYNSQYLEEKQLNIIIPKYLDGRKKKNDLKP